MGGTSPESTALRTKSECFEIWSCLPLTLPTLSATTDPLHGALATLAVFGFLKGAKNVQPQGLCICRLLCIQTSLLWFLQNFAKMSSQP